MDLARRLGELLVAHPAANTCEQSSNATDRHLERRLHPNPNPNPNPSSASKQPFLVGVQMARAFKAPVRVLTVLPDDAPAPDFGVNVATASVMEFLEQIDLEGVQFEVQGVRGDPAERIVDSTKDAGLVVVGSRGFDPVAPEHLGPITSRTLRYTTCNALMVREVDGDLRRRETAIEKIADDYKAAWNLMKDDREAEALPLLESAAQRAPANAVIQEAFAVVLDRVGRKVEARGRREIAANDQEAHRRRLSVGRLV